MWTVMPIIEETGWVEIMDGDEFIGAARGKNSERNGRLMASAPDLLHALKSLVQVVAHLDPCPATLEQACAAIAKATGEKA